MKTRVDEYYIYMYGCLIKNLHYKMIITNFKFNLEFKNINVM